MGFFAKGPSGNESGGKVNGGHRSGKAAKGKGGVNKPLKGKHHGRGPVGKSGRPDPYADDGDWRGGW